jgi:hypothetical protein
LSAFRLSQKAERESVGVFTASWYCGVQLADKQVVRPVRRTLVQMAGESKLHGSGTNSQGNGEDWTTSIPEPSSIG